MTIKSFSKDTVIEYIPAFGGNRCSEEPCIVKIRFVPYSKTQEYSRQIAARSKGHLDALKSAEIAQQVQKKQFCENVEGVSGFFVDGREVTSPEELYEHAPAEMISEIFRAMEDSVKLAEGQRDIS